MSKIIHPISGAIAFVTIATFWFATAGAELFGSHAQIVLVKTAIPWGMLILVPAVAATGGSGFRRAAGRRGGILGTKARRMPIIAANGAFVLIPCALFLSWKARSGAFDAAFYTVQVVELAAGALNVALMAQSMRDGLRLSGRWSRRYVQT